MNHQSDFCPNWASRPGATILRLLNDRGLSTREFADVADISVSELRDLLSGRATIEPVIASKLSIVLGGSAVFWLTREEQYRQDISRREVHHIGQGGREWIKSLPIRDMESFGWIDEQPNNSSLVRECMRFFDIGQLDVWHRSYATMLENTAFRKSERFASNIGSLAAWFRQAELEADTISCASWDPNNLRSALPRLRSLTWTRNPAVFVPKLRDVCAACGIACVLVPLPKGCTASGATWFSSSSKAILVLSARYLSDDQFWFTFFHEAGHLLIHEPAGPIIEEPDISSKHMEDEANTFASVVLIPREFRDELFSMSPTSKRVFDFSKKIRVAPGIVVGQLQHFDRLAQDKLNYLKRRFVWSVSHGSVTLEMA